MNARDKRWCALRARNLNLPIAVVESALATAQRHTRRNLPPQQPCDHGLFGDEADQLDLVEMLQDPTNGD